MTVDWRYTLRYRYNDSKAAYNSSLYGSYIGLTDGTVMETSLPQNDSDAVLVAGQMANLAALSNQ